MKKTITFIVLFISVFSFSQSRIKKADKLFNAYAFSEAAQLYEKEIAQNKTLIGNDVYLKTASAYFLINNIRKAYEYYDKVYQAEGQIAQPHLLRYVLTLRGLREYEKAYAVYLKYLESRGDSDQIRLFKRDVENFNALLGDESESRFTIQNLEANSEYSDFGAAFYKDQVIFSSSRPAPGVVKGLYSWTEQPYLSLLVADRTEFGDLQNVNLFSKQITSDFHDATFSMAHDGQTVYYTSSNINNKRLVLDNFSRNHFKVFKAQLIDGKLDQIEELFFNSDDYSCGHPFITPDGKFLFFASDMPGGYGGADIYYCTIFEDGMLSSPKNAGPNINTEGNDFFPAFYENTLYFSSNGHVGFGGLDIYESSWDAETGFARAENLGKVVNTPYDDFAMVFYKDNKNGYFSSNRPGGKGDDDIYAFFRKPLPCDQIISGRVTDKKSKDPIEKATITVRDSLKNSLVTTETDADGNYVITVGCNQKIFISAAKEEYIEQQVEKVTGDVHQEAIDGVDFELDKLSDLITKDDSGVEKINLETIYFDFNKWDITPQAAAVLDKAVEVMNLFPDMVIKIEAHTDSRGSDSYNLNLSDKRAKATQTYLYSQGIVEERIISAIGYGESRLLNHCSDGVKCSDEEHDINRRSDFIILKR